MGGDWLELSDLIVDVGPPSRRRPVDKRAVLEALPARPDGSLDEAAVTTPSVVPS
jgi:hypothetical protein